MDARYLSADPSGIGRYSRNLIDELLQLEPRHEYHVFVRAGFFPPEEWNEGVVCHAVEWPPVGMGTLFRMGGEIDRLACDLVHVHCPLTPLRLKTPLIITMHDWQPVTVPDFSGERPFWLKSAYDAFYRWQYPRSVRRARRVACDSDATLSWTQRLAPVAAERCRTVHLGLDRHFMMPPTAGEIQAATARFGLPERFILFVGSSRPNKQLATLVKAFHLHKMNHAEAEGLHLLLVLKRDRFFAPIEASIRELGLEGSILILDGVPDSDLRVLYKRAALLAMATTDEGFGFPVLEALAQGTPVVIAEDGALPELAGEAALRVPPRDPDALANAFHRLLTDPLLRTRFQIMGPPRASRFDWRITAKAMLELYEQVASERRQTAPGGDNKASSSKS